MAVGTEIYGTWSVPSNTQTAGTVITRLVPPYAGGKGGPYLHKVDGNGKRAAPAPRAFTHVSGLAYADTGTAHQATVMRPLNWTYTTAATAANATTMVLAADPGAYSTAYAYPLPSGATKPAGVANNAMASGDYVAFQLRDGTWYFGTTTGLSSLTMTLGTAVPNVTGGGCDANTVVYFYGVSTDSNPQTGIAHHYWLSGTGSASREFLGQGGGGTLPSLNPGDPLIFYSANATNAGTLVACSGFYADR